MSNNTVEQLLSRISTLLSGIPIGGNSFEDTFLPPPETLGTTDIRDYSFRTPEEVIENYSRLREAFKKEINNLFSQKQSWEEGLKQLNELPKLREEFKTAVKGSLKRTWKEIKELWREAPIGMKAGALLSSMLIPGVTFGLSYGLGKIFGEPSPPAFLLQKKLEKTSALKPLLKLAGKEKLIRDLSRIVETFEGMRGAYNTLSSELELLRKKISGKTKELLEYSSKMQKLKELKKIEEGLEGFPFEKLSWMYKNLLPLWVQASLPALYIGVPASLGLFLGAQGKSSYGQLLAEQIKKQVEDENLEKDIMEYYEIPKGVWNE